MGVRKIKKKKTLLILLMVSIYLLTLLPVGMKTLRAVEFSGEGSSITSATETATNVTETSSVTEATTVSDTTTTVNETTQSVAETTASVPETTSISVTTTGVTETTSVTQATSVTETTSVTQATTAPAATSAVEATSVTQATSITQATTVPLATSPVETTKPAPSQAPKAARAPADVNVMAAAPVIQPLAIPAAGPYFSDPGYTAVLLSGGSTNQQAIAYIMWVQGGEILIAIKANDDALSMTLDGTPSTSSLAFPIGATLSVDTYLNLAPYAELQPPDEKKARWEIFSFPLTLMNVSGSYPFTVDFQGGGWAIAKSFTVVVPTATANLDKTWVGGPKNPVSIQLYSKVGENGLPIAYGNPISLSPNTNGQATHSWTNLPLTNKSAQLLTYFIDEANPGEGYDVEFSSSYNTSTKTYTFTLYNIFTQPITASKEWSGGPKPPVTFQLYRRIGSFAGLPVGSPVTLDGTLDANERVAWSYIWPYQRVSDNTGNLYTYYVVETTTPPNYSKIENGLTVTNTYTSPLSNVVAYKVWVGGTTRPAVTFQLYRKVGTGTGEALESTVQLDGAIDANELSPWQYTWMNLPTHRQADGLLYTYYVIENPVPSNYAADAVDDLTVTNTYLLSSVTVSKLVTGNMGDRTKEFTFTATITNDYQFQSGTDYTLSEDKKTATFDLKHSENVTLIVPIGATVSIVESGNAGYVVTYSMNSLEPVSGSTVNLSVPATASTIQFTNDNEVIIPTGIALDTLPYILILLLLGAGVLGGVIRKRRHTDFD